MSAASVDTAAEPGEAATVRWAARRLAVLAAAVLLWSFVSVLWTVTTIVGGRDALVLVVGVALVAGTVATRYLDERTGLLLGGGVVVIGLGVYSLSVPTAYLAVATVRTVVADLFVLLTGNLSIVRIVEADVWALTVAPAPVFLTWYLALRGRYELSALVGMASLGLFVLTGDAPGATTLVGATSALAVIGFGAVEEMEGDWRQIMDLGLVLAVTVLAARLLRLVPDRGLASGPSPRGGLGTPTMEGTLVTVDEELPLVGSVSLSPTVRFEVTADRPAFWHAGAYDRYTGDSWLRSGQSGPFRGSLVSPPGDADELTQSYEARSPLGSMPAAWRPTGLRSEPPTGVDVTSTGAMVPTGSLEEGESYTVVSEVPQWSEDRLHEAGTDYPDDLADRYRQVPESTPDRLAEHTAEITADARTRYDAAVAIEGWLAENKDYSLTVNRPDGDVAAGFVFRMSAGYCTYFATAMAVMLRTQGVPARLAVGYTPGEQVEDDRWVVRGLDSHAWTDVYFPGIGWVPFDPTPAAPRDEVEQTRVEHARESGTSGVDTDETEGGTPEPTETPTPTPSPTPSPTDTGGSVTPTPADGPDADVGTGPNGTQATPAATPTPEPQDRLAAGYDGGASGTGPDADPAGGGEGLAGTLDEVTGGRDRLTVLAGAAGVALGAYRFGLVRRGYDAVRLRVQFPTDDPDHDALRAFERLELLLADQFRERVNGETPRDYLRSLEATGLDDRAFRVARIYERARYGDGVDRDEADEAMELVEELVGEYARF
ncbi:transglutaminase [Halobacteriales archaeon QS_1_68_20]|nr:MAG: transglutaminase [Halobacteriales archaeon QS_1_68_20]